MCVVCLASGSEHGICTIYYVLVQDIHGLDRPHVDKGTMRVHLQREFACYFDSKVTL